MYEGFSFLGTLGNPVDISNIRACRATFREDNREILLIRLIWARFREGLLNEGYSTCSGTNLASS